MNSFRSIRRLLLTVVLLAVVLAPRPGRACACGCGVFDAGPRSIFPTGEGGLVFMEYNYVNQDQNWSGSSSANAADNADKVIRTSFFTAGCQYMYDADWGALLEVPYWYRTFETDDGSGGVRHATHDALGDIRIKGIYDGFSPDHSAGLTFGLKLPTGDYTYSGFDRDTNIGTGSTDALLGGFLRGRLPVGNHWDWFATGQMDQPFLYHGGYRPGSDVTLVGGIYYSGWSIGDVQIAPLLQATAAHHWRDRGSAANPADSGYDRLILSSGVEADWGDYKFYADVGCPAYQHVNGNQLVAPVQGTVRMSYSF